MAAHLGEVMWALGEKDQAHSLLLQAAKNDPDNAQLRDTIDQIRSMADVLDIARTGIG